MPIPFSVFLGFTIVGLAMLLLFFCKMPKSTWPEYAKKSDSLIKPKAFMVQLFALIGFSSVITLFGSTVASSVITPGIIGLGFAASMIQAVLLHALRDNLTLLYVVYLVIAVALVILYLLLEPYLGYSLRGLTLEDLIEVVAEETDENAVPEPVTVLATSSGADNISKIQAEPKAVRGAGEDSPHTLRMRTLLQHTFSPLTRREYQLADCIMRGQRRAEIAEEMGVKPETVTKYTNQLYNKFGIHRRQDLFRLAEQLDRDT
jgi:DNA-binding CsgD family transcriptional regulator